ncbi:MAG: roadblock/LC7 domain-containing protein [candidate division Zixibacteria bacterium]|nr:roadblock/LC7 domain-containing protein [candidate division Zixibacteria bacterium]
MPGMELVLFEEDYTNINEILATLVRETNSKFSLLVDRSGQLISSQGDTENMDSLSFASLSAGNYAATSELAKILGQEEFSVLFHQGTNESIHLSVVAKRVILVVVFDNKTTLGLVRLRVKKAVEELSAIFNRIFQKVAERAFETPSPLGDTFSSVAESEIDNLFKD